MVDSPCLIFTIIFWVGENYLGLPDKRIDLHGGIVYNSFETFSSVGCGGRDILWQKQMRMSGVLSEVRKREHYDKPSVKRKKKSEAARKRKFR